MSSDAIGIFARLKGAAFHELVTSSLAGDHEAISTLFAWIQPAIVRYCRSRIGRSGSAYSSADDVAQEICMAVLGALSRYGDEPESFLPFVFGIAAHKVADHYRRAGRDRSDPSADVPDVIDCTAQEAFNQAADTRRSDPEVMGGLIDGSSLGDEVGVLARDLSRGHRLDATAASVTAEVLAEADMYVEKPEARIMAADLRDRLHQLLETLPLRQRQILQLRLVVGLSAQETAELVGLTSTAVRVTQHRALAKLRAMTNAAELV
jgi:RNA polymerase sigma factor (sigma-70 family)